jgi:hypothetical protein
MTFRKKASRKKHRNMTAHCRAMSDSSVKTLISQLRGHWPRIGRIERGDRLRRLAALGCSTRGLERELGQSATSIRRHMTLAGLSEQEREAVEAGRSTNEILARKADADRLRKRRVRIALDKKTGRWSDKLADSILAFCKTVNGVPEGAIGATDLPTYLCEVRNALSQLEASGVGGSKIPAHFSLKRRFNRTRPDESADEFWTAFRARWLANFLLAEESERDIRELALKKTESRAKELDPVMTPMQLYWAAAERRAWIASGPPRRTY